VSGIGASSSLPHVPAKVSSQNAERPLSLGGGNRSSCPVPAVRDTRRDRLNWVATCPWHPGSPTVRYLIPQRTFKALRFSFMRI
jgi:hypothetical protein